MFFAPFCCINLSSLSETVETCMHQLSIPTFSGCGGEFKKKAQQSYSYSSLRRHKLNMQIPYAKMFCAEEPQAKTVSL